uniref:Uncharacterized protein n=1 Tax=Ciona savignyi TaxID=51511 RepID=H2ZPD9_CIOSA
RKPWKFQVSDDSITLKYREVYDQSKFTVVINDRLGVGVTYFGWAVSEITWCKLGVEYSPLSKTLKEIENFKICVGCDNFLGSGSIPHIITQSASAFGTGQKAIPKIKQIALRSADCTIFIPNGDKCKHCCNISAQVVSTNGKKSRKLKQNPRIKEIDTTCTAKPPPIIYIKEELEI